MKDYEKKTKSFYRRFDLTNPQKWARGRYQIVINNLKNNLKNAPEMSEGRGKIKL